MQSINSATLSGSYLPLGSPTPDGARIFKIVNNSSVDVLVSIDGVTNHDIVTKGGFCLYDIGTNRGNPSPMTVLPADTQFYVSGSSGTGFIYLVVLYGYTNTQPVPL